MINNRQTPKDLKIVKEELGYARDELEKTKKEDIVEFLNIDVIIVHINKAENLVNTSIERDKKPRSTK